jgi:predicted dehydrogenase
MTNRSWRVGIVGCGAIAWPHLEHLGRLAAQGRVEIVGVCDRSAATARFAAERAGVAHVCSDIDELLGRAAPDVVHVLTPPHTHEMLSVHCLEAGAHVLCEKPAAPDRAALERVLAAAERVGRRFTESQNLRWNDQIVAIRAAIERGDLGQVLDIDLLLALDLAGGPLGAPGLGGPSVLLPGGAVHDLLPHLAYLLVHLAGPDLEQLAAQRPGNLDVLGRLRNVSGNERLGFDHLDALVDGASVRARIRVVGDLRPDGLRVVVRGARGVMETDLYHPYLRIETAARSGGPGLVAPVIGGARMAWSGATGIVDKVRRHDVFHGLGRLLDVWYAGLDEPGQGPVPTEAMRATASLTERLIELGGRR